MKMFSGFKRVVCAAALIVIAGAFLAACSTGQAPLKQIEVTNLTDETTQTLLKDALTEAGVSDKRMSNFDKQLNIFNSSVSQDALTSGFETMEATAIGYDPFAIQDEWLAKNPNFEGYNCRITAFGLTSEGIKADESFSGRDDEVLFMDYLTLGKDVTALAGDSLSKFNAIYDSVPTTDSKDVKEHVKNLQNEWTNRGVSFDKRNKISLVCVVFHDKPEENKDILFIGHAGTLLEKDGKLYFVEKIAFQEPYRMIKFDNRTQLSDYLMEKYDVDVDQPTAAPFIMENNQLMSGYRGNPLKYEFNEGEKYNYYYYKSLEKRYSKNYSDKCIATKCRLGHY